MAKHRIALLSAGHAGVDFYQGAVPAMVPFLVAERGYGYVAASGIVLALTLLSSVVQPAFGAAADRWRMPWVVPVAMTTAGLGVAVSGVTDDYLPTWLAVALTGLGVAAYHPESARLARQASEGSHVGMSWFSLGGTLGFALAPVLVTPLLAAGGLAASPYLVIPGVLGALLTVTAMRRGTAGPGAGGPAGDARDDWPAFLRLGAVMVFRSIAYVGLSAFAALHAGGGTAGAVALFLLFAGGAAGTVLGGRLATRFGRVRVLRWAYALAVPAVLAAVLMPLAGIFFAGLALYVPFSLHVTMGQDYLPNRPGTASGVTLGLAVSVGGLASPLVGALAEATTLGSALLVLPVFAALAWLVSWPLAEPAIRVSR
ncbi:MFS transporter [Nonomuraea sp. NPDC050663]|uniref:MFS transporter n=1 Tax=Nonomuraea sp. NPDC050663 TaxID=3364370 RepID=UPI00378FE77B